MAHKHVLFRSAAREKILRGATQLTDAVRVTLGPRSKSVLIEKKWGAPIVCNDGVTIAKEFDLKDPDENLGARMLRQAAEKTGELVGDGTSTATVLAHAIFADGLRNVVAGASAIDLKRGLDRGVKAAIEALRAMSRPVATRKEKAQVATISAHNDSAIGELVADAMEKVGGEGVITVEEVEDHRDRARRGRRDAVRPRLPVALFHHQPREDGGGAGGRAWCCSATARSPRSRT